MVTDITLLYPLLIIILAAGIAALFGLPALNRKLTLTQLSWLLALAPLSAFGLFIQRSFQMGDNTTFGWQWEWLPSLELKLGLYFDDLSLLFAFIITFIGTLIIIYAGQYFKGDQGAWRFMAYLLLFMASMLGVVMAGDVISLFIFWEGTSILSYLLIAYKYQYPDARRGAFRSLFITGGGGIALLAGLLIVSNVAGTTQFGEMLGNMEALREALHEHTWYGLMLALVGFGAFTKSAQFPAHIWLPGAMSAPTPASAYLHSATMVKAGIYIMARMNPVLGFSPEWFWMLTIVGGVTMIAGAYLGLKQNDLKGLLAYSTISQLGVLMMLIGQDIPEAYKALVVGIVAHAMYKSALFLVAGIIDHETGTRDLRRLGGLHKVMPYTLFAGGLAALSMAGLPPMFGFLAKETLLVTALHPEMTSNPLLPFIIRSGVVVAGALMLAQAGLLIWETFFGQPKDETVHGHEAPLLMWLMPLIPAAMSLVLAILPGPKQEATLLAGAAGAAFGGDVKVSTVLFHGLTVELALSIVAISLGLAIFYFRRPIRAWQNEILPNLTFNTLYDGVLAGIDKLAYWATRLQQGQLRPYLATIIAGTAVLVVGFWSLGTAVPFAGMHMLTFDLAGELDVLRLFTLIVIVGASLATVFLQRDLQAIFALGASGLATAVYFILEPAPDVALVQIVVDILSVVILVFTLTRLPRRQRRKADEIRENYQQHRSKKTSFALWRDLGVALMLGAIVTVITFSALTDSDRTSQVSGEFADRAKTETGATDIVGAIVVDFRALDTLIEITVFGIAGIGISLLLYQAAPKHGDNSITDEPFNKHLILHTFGISSQHTSAFIRISTYVLLPLAMMLAATHMMYGHDRPGDGFTAGVIVSLAAALWYVIFGYEEASERLAWLKPSTLIGLGVLLAIGTGTTAAIVTGNFLGNHDFTANWGFLPAGFHISTSFLIEVAICLAVLGSASHMLQTLGHPQTTEVEGEAS